MVTASAPHEAIVGGLPDGATIVALPGEALDMVHVFATERATLGRKPAGYREAIEPDAMIWVLWRRKPQAFRPI